MNPVREVLPGLFLVDIGHFGEPELGGAYILAADAEAALVDSGTSLAKERLLQALADLGLARDQVRWIFLTHVHLDHAGGAGALLPELPQARVVVHPRGAKHLVDPTKLVASTQSATGPRFRFYGQAFPIPEERVHPAQDGETFALGALRVQAVDAPGHAPHHLCFFVPERGLLFTGDAAGLYLKGRLLPTTVPPSFDLEAWLGTLARLEALAPKVLLFTHFGPGEPRLLGQYRELLLSWVERVRRHKDLPDEEAVAAILEELKAEGWPVGPGVSGDWSMSVRGVLQYLRRKEAGG
ncbi:MAG: MBL fold metallo-hydrolase [Candidatus Bipolaricaulota bacterium]|nr:MBL fold metallo-hydrolase [Candidatus Bipolaricaulota bacterium]MDW8151656.1 MBL fold metallo-hydrolase [Candidatus Bipolaricaulota bacterium]